MSQDLYFVMGSTITWTTDHIHDFYHRWDTSNFKKAVKYNWFGGFQCTM